jgi:hypothetical protein
MWFTEVYITNIFVKLTVCFVCVYVYIFIERVLARVWVCVQLREEYIITFIQHYLNSIV